MKEIAADKDSFVDAANIFLDILSAKNCRLAGKTKDSNCNCMTLLCEKQTTKIQAVDAMHNFFSKNSVSRANRQMSQDCKHQKNQEAIKQTKIDKIIKYCSDVNSSVVASSS